MKAKFSARLWGRALAALPAVACLAACSLVTEELAECPVPVTEIRFVYEYNMEGANAFHNQVDCLTAYFFDADGQLADIQTVLDRAQLADEDYRMRPQLDAGDYHVVVYGGMGCEYASFGHPDQPQIGDPLAALRVRLDPAVYDPDTPAEGRRLHNHFYGAADFTVDDEQDTHVKVEMMRNTNSIQIALQQEGGQDIDVNDFTFEITDDNNDFDHQNNLIPTGQITYKPWNTENRSTGTVGNDDEEDSDSARARRIFASRADDEAGDDSDEDEGGDAGAKDYHAALAQFHVSRLVPYDKVNKLTSPTLTVRHADSGEAVFQVSLIYYMMLFKNDNPQSGADFMSAQEYLDRENSWNFVFFLQNGQWSESQIHVIVNDWEVRINNTDF